MALLHAYLSDRNGRMMKLIHGLLITALAGIFSGCASLPDAKVGYYLAQSGVKLKVIRTVACDKKNNVIVASSATPAVTHMADLNQFVEIDLAGLKGPFSDTDVKFDFFDDGRLRNVNTTSTGQGETILKTVTTIIGGGAPGAASPAIFNDPGICADINNATGNEPLTLIYEGEVDLNSKDKQQIKPDISSTPMATKLIDIIGSVNVSVGKTEVPKAPLTNLTKSSKIVIKARQPGLMGIVVTADIKTLELKKLWEGQLPVAQFGIPYELPIQKPALFGKEVFAAAFSESGALTSVQYVNNTGAGQVLNVVNSAMTSLRGETTAQKALDVKAEADLIAEQQRLVQCQADHSKCK